MTSDHSLPMPRRKRKRPRLVIAHADHDVRGDLEFELKHRGFLVFPADSGFACLAKIEWFTPDVLLLDVDLLWGGSDGVLAVMQSSDTWRKIPVALIASHRNFYKTKPLGDFCVADILILPMSMEAFAERCIELLDTPFDLYGAPVFERDGFRGS